ncbi:unnamed protein product [Caretta caretta]
MDSGSRFFYALEKRRGAKKHVTFLLVEDETLLMDLKEMRGRASTFYANLFSLDPTDTNAHRVLWTELPTVSAGDRDRLDCLSLWSSSRKPSIACLLINLWAWTG